MSTSDRRRSTSQSPSHSSAKMASSVSENLKKGVMASKPQVAKKRPALVDITNQSDGLHRVPQTTISSIKPLLPCMAKISKTKRESSTGSPDITDLSGFTLPAPLSPKSNVPVCSIESSVGSFPPAVGDADLASPCRRGAMAIFDVSPTKIGSCSLSLDESMSTCDSLKIPEFQLTDCGEISAISLERKTESTYEWDLLLENVTIDEVVDIDDYCKDPQLCATIAPEIYKNLRTSETKKRPSVGYMERIQKDINASMRAVLIDWLVEVAEEYRLKPDTLFLTINYIDRYLSGNAIYRQRLQLLGVACMLIAAKYEEICAPHVEEFCYVTDHSYSREEVLQMETDVLDYLKFEMEAPTAVCFLRQFVHIAVRNSKVPSLPLEFLANYITELSLLEYSMLSYAPSLIASSATFLAKYIISSSKNPWNSTLTHYTLYQASDLHYCVKALHRMCCSSSYFNLPAIREKYSQHKYKFVAKKYCPRSIPPEFFHD